MGQSDNRISVAGAFHPRRCMPKTIRSPQHRALLDLLVSVRRSEADASDGGGVVGTTAVLCRRGGERRAAAVRVAISPGGRQVWQPRARGVGGQRGADPAHGLAVDAGDPHLLAVLALVTLTLRRTPSCRPAWLITRADDRIGHRPVPRGPFNGYPEDAAREKSRRCFETARAAHWTPRRGHKAAQTFRARKRIRPPSRPLRLRRRRTATPHRLRACGPVRRHQRGCRRHAAAPSSAPRLRL